MGRQVYVRDKKVPGKPGWWPQAKKIEAVTAWLSTGSIPIVSTLTKVPLDTLKTWRKQPWWKEIESQIKEEDNQQLDAKFTRIIAKTLDTIDDRLDNGNFQFDPKTGRVLRIPVNIRDTHRVMSDLVNQRRLIRHEPTQITSSENQNDRLLKLAEQFAQFALGTAKPDDMKVVEGSEIYDGDFEEADTSQEPLVEANEPEDIPTPTQTP